MTHWKQIYTGITEGTNDKVRTQRKTNCERWRKRNAVYKWRPEPESDYNLNKYAKRWSPATANSCLNSMNDLHEMLMNSY